MGNRHREQSAPGSTSRLSAYYAAIEEPKVNGRSVTFKKADGTMWIVQADTIVVEKKKGKAPGAK